MIESKRVATLADNREAPLEVPAAIAFDGSNYYVVGADTDHAITVYGSNGGFIRRLNRRGQGPGEFTLVVSLQPSGEGVVALDRANGRRVRLTSALEVADERRIEFLAESRGHLLLPDGTEVVRARVPADPGRQHAWVHELKSTGELGRGFDFSPAEGNGTKIYPAPSTDSTIWVYDRDTHFIGEYALDGRLVRDYLRPPQWFLSRPSDDERGRGEQAPGRMPYMMKSIVTEGHLVWILSQVPDPDWDEPLPPRPRDLLGVLDDVTDSVLEVLDYRTGEMLVTQRLDRFAQQLLPGPKLVTVGATGLGVPIVEIHDLAVKGVNAPPTLRDGGR